MSSYEYITPPGGMPEQSQPITDRSVFTTAYALIPRGVLRDIVTSQFPHWEKTRAWVLARPMSGFSETFVQSVLEIQPGGGSEQPEPDPEGEGAYFVLSGALTLTLENTEKTLGPGGFAWIAPGERYRVFNKGDEPVMCHWIRKRYERVEGVALPDSFFTSDQATDPMPMAGASGRWRTTRFMDPAALGYDMHVTIVTLEPGAVIPFAETHVMEHGLYVLQGRGIYRLNTDWVEVTAGDFMWLRAFCPQACYAGGDTAFRYLLYKDVNRHPSLS
jgi:(S)-ureidoglycine aminohydrolase